MTRPIDDSHDPARRSWVESANDRRTDFPIQNLPFGVFKPRDADAPLRIGVAIGDQILDLARCGELGWLIDLPRETQTALAARSLNGLMALGPKSASMLRQHLSRILAADSRQADPRALVPMNAAELVVPAAIGDYTDFYASVFHATHVGQLFRPDTPLLPNYKWLPVGYHGRVSSIVVSGNSVRRPWGQTRAAGETPIFRPSRMLDYELEVGLFVGNGNALGDPIPLGEADAHLFGLCLLNDWSARDIQSWEYQPLGPFLGKNFATTVSPWVVTLEALAPFRCAPFPRSADDPAPLPYLSSPDDASLGGFDVQLEAGIRSARMQSEGLPPLQITRSRLRDLYWTAAQLLTHHASNGCNLHPGDLLATGTVSGEPDGSRGCLLEITRQGRAPITLPTGETRSFLEDGDEIILSGYCEREGYVRIGLGVCAGTVTPARESWSGDPDRPQQRA